MKLPGEKAKWETDLFSPAWHCLLWCTPPARPFIIALPNSAQFSQNYLSCIWSHIKEKLGPYSQILPFADRGTEMKGEGRVLCSLPAASCAGSLYWIGINRTGPRWAAYDWHLWLTGVRMRVQLCQSSCSMSIEQLNGPGFLLFSQSKTLIKIKPGDIDSSI